MNVSMNADRKIIRNTIIHLVWIIFLLITSPCFGNDSKIQLSPEENSWIRKNHIVRVRIGNAPPFMLTDGIIQGIAIDYLEKIFKQNGIKFVYVRGTDVTWPQALKYIEQHHVVDMVPTAKITDERKKHMIFTEEYIFAPWVIFTREDADFLSSIEDLKGKTVSVEEGYVIHEKLKREYPKINLKVVPARLKNYSQIPIRDLSTGLVDAYIGNLLSTTYIIQTKGYTNIKVAAPTPFDNHNQAMAIRSDWPELAGIINKTLAAMTPDEHGAILNKWLTMRYEYGISKTDLIKWLLSIAGVASVFIGFVLIWNKRLKTEIAFRKKTEELLRESERRLREAQQLANLGNWFWDVSSGKVEWSDEVFKIFRLDPKEFTPQIDSILDLSPWPEDHKRDKELIQKAVESREVGAYEQRFLRPDGSKGYYFSTFQGIYDDDGKLTAIRGAVQDITKRKLDEMELIKGRAKLEAALESMTDAVSISDVEGQFIEFNNAFATFHRFKNKNECLKTLPEYPVILDVYLPNGTLAPLDMWAVARALRGETEINAEYSLRRKDTGETWIGSYNFAPIRDENGEIVGSVVVGRDITEQKQMEGHLRQSQKLQSIGTLAGGVAHEINNPINGIMNYAQLIVDKTGADNPASEFAEEIIHETKRISTIVRNLLTFARQEKGAHSPARMIDIVNDTMSLIQTVFKRDQISLEIDVPEDLPKIKCRSQQIQQVIMNIVTNARDALNEKYSDYDENKKIMISSRSSEKEGRQWIRTTIEDRGVGIADDIRERIFDPFYTTKGRTVGTGLGLSISYSIVKDHHGELTFESEPGQYTKFYMDLLVDNDWDLEKNGPD